ncbi:MAG: IS66 family insertion sequence element accessory protein TnpB [Clostridia bacterium]
MLNLENDNEIYLACGATDMRKSINGLCEIVHSTFDLDPFMSKRHPKHTFTK